MTTPPDTVKVPREATEALLARLRAYSADPPMDGRHSDAAGMDAYELISQAEVLLSLAAPPPQPEPGWQPIETAPKDETTLILCGPSQYDDQSQRRVVTGFWSPRTLAWVMIGGAGITINPTHWMPLPAPPKETKT